LLRCYQENLKKFKHNHSKWEDLLDVKFSMPQKTPKEPEKKNEEDEEESNELPVDNYEDSKVVYNPVEGINS
jgi:hypothetical protein